MRRWRVARSGTLVFQSHPPDDAAPWPRRCLASVADWAAACGHAHVVLDDAFLEVVPRDLVERCGAERLPVTDLARLI